MQRPPRNTRATTAGRAASDCNWRIALPPEQREVVLLKIDGELTFAQIAEVIGASMNTAASRYRYDAGETA